MSPSDRGYCLAPAILTMVWSCSAIAQAGGPGSSQQSEHTEVAGSYSRDWLKYNSEDWSDARIELLHKFADRKLLIGGATESKRFGLNDTAMSLAGYYPLGRSTTGYAEVSASGTHRVLPRGSVHLQLAQSLGDGWGVHAGVRRVEFNTADVTIGDLTLEKYFSSYRAALAAFPSRSSAAGSAASYRLQFADYYGEENSVQLMLVRGKEVDRPTGVDQVVATSIRSLALFGRHWLDRSWYVAWSLGRTLQDTATRKSAGLALGHRF